MTSVHIRERRQGEDERIAFVLRRAFGGEAEAALVAALRTEGAMVCELIAEDEHEGVIGHVAFSRLETRAGDLAISAVALAPLAVLPGRQRQGAGSALVTHGLARMRASEIELAVVLGDPAYYSRFGFSTLLARLLRTPYSGDGLQAIELAPNVLGRRAWTCAYPAAFATLS